MQAKIPQHGKIILPFCRAMMSQAIWKHPKTILQLAVRKPAKCKQQKRERQQRKSKGDRTTKGKKKNILIIGDSIVKHLDEIKLKGSLRNGQNVDVKSLSGANVEDMADYSKHQ